MSIGSTGSFGKVSPPSSKEPSVPSEGSTGKGGAVKRAEGTRQIAKNNGSSDKVIQGLSNRQVKQLIKCFLNQQGKEPDAQFYKNIQSAVPGLDKKIIIQFLTSFKLIRKDVKSGTILVKSLSKRQVKSKLQLTKMELGEYDLKAASSAMSKYISQIEEKAMGCCSHKKAVAKKVAKQKAKQQKERTGRVAPDTFHASMKKNASNSTSALASKDCLLTIDSFRLMTKGAKKKRKAASKKKD